MNGTLPEKSGLHAVRDRLMSEFAVLGGQTLLIGVALYALLRGWRRELGVPVTFASDGLFYLMQSKSTVDNGWWWFNPRLGAPFGLDELAFPANSNVDQAIVWAVSRGIGNPLSAINLAWVVMVVLSGVAATWCLRRLEVSRWSAVVAGTLFALCPYALYRNVAHFGMVVYLVPFVCTAALQLIAGRVPARGYWRGSGAILLGGCALLAFDYVYYAFFGCFVIACATAIGMLTHSSRGVLKGGATCFVVIVACTFLNLAPSLYSWNRSGKPIIFEEKLPAHAELFGLKIRSLISPSFHHLLPPLRWWNEKEAAAQFPLEGETWNARLGIVGSLGFLGLLGLLVVPTAARRLANAEFLQGASRLTICAVLLATTGGFGSLFSLLVSPDIRAYARMYPFIAFFSLAAVALLMDAVMKTRWQRMFGCVVILVVGLTDQSAAATPMNAEYQGNAAEVVAVRSFVNRLESRLTTGASVLQLPFRTYLNYSTIARMEPLDHLKLYLVSNKLRWSFPALSNAQVAWQSFAAQLEPAQLGAFAVSEGFSAIVVDRYGYQDGGVAVTAALRGYGVLAETDRYIGFDIALQSQPHARLAPMTTWPPATLGISACASPALIGLNQVDSRLPNGQQPLHVSGSRLLKIVGWAVDPQARLAAKAVDVAVDGTLYPGIYGVDRSDVAGTLGNPAYSQSGYLAVIPANTLQSGSHILSVRAMSASRDCYYQGQDIAIIVD